MTSTLYHGDCLIEMDKIEPASVDLIAADLPYGTTACKWDTVIPFEPLWERFKRVLKPRGAVVLNGAQPFTTDLIMSNREWFKYCWVWDKVSCSGHLLSKKQPLRAYEDICVFYKEQPLYNPILRNKPPGAVRKNKIDIVNRGQVYLAKRKYKQHDGRTIPINKSYPVNIIRISGYGKHHKRLHPTQKPVALLEYLIRTYTNSGDTVLDPVMGSGTTGHACANLDRHFIGIELDANYFRIASDRIAKAERAARQLEMEL